MSQNSTQSIPKDKFLTMVTNLLHRAFIDAGRTEAKKLYRAIEEGRNVQLSTVEMEDKSMVRFNLAMDHEQFPGQLNYGAFRLSVATLINNLVAALKEKQEIPIFNSTEQAESQPQSMIFGLTAVTVENDTPSVMVLGADVEGRGASVQLRLMYLDHQQFVEQQASAPDNA